MCTDYFKSYVTTGGVDAVTSASVILDAPSGSYLVLINTTCHTDDETLATWVTFFSGGEVDYIFEDVVCTVASVDTGAVDMAESLQSRLPENQMRIESENQTMVLSRLDYSKFDVLVMSAEFAATTLDSLDFGEDILVVSIQEEE